MAGGKSELDDFYAALKSGTTVANFLERYDGIIRFIHKEGLTKDYRLGRGRVKKLRDEVSPVARFVKVHAAPKDRICFALDDTAPDCFVKHGGDRLREIELASTAANSPSARRRAAALAGRNPAKKKRSVGRPETVSAASPAEAPGMAVTAMPEAIAASTSL